MSQKRKRPIWTPEEREAQDRHVDETLRLLEEVRAYYKGRIEAARLREERRRNSFLGRLMRRRAA